VVLRVLALVLSASVILLAWVVGNGPLGVGYLGLFTLLLIPGLPIGFTLFGSRHAAGWVAGAVIGYALSAIILWLPADVGLTARGWVPVFWSVLSGLLVWLFRDARVLVHLPAWSRVDTMAILGVLLVVPLLLAAPFSRIGERDAEGNRRYRAYFTADFLWHMALSAELARADAPVRNPYLERRPLRYYWGYFVPPAILARTMDVEESLDACLLVNALGAGLLFVASIYLYGWCAIPRAGPMAISVLITILAASAEGLFALVSVARDGRPLSDLQQLNIDAVTAWIFQGLTIDSLPRSLWYTPQHATACALGLTGLIVPSTVGPGVRPSIALIAGVPLGLAVVFSPFLGAAFCLIYGVTVLWITLTRETGRRAFVLATHGLAAVATLVALGWCSANRTFEGAAASIALGISQRAATAPLQTLGLAIGPVLALAASGLIAGRGRRYGWQTSITGLILGLLLFFFVTLSVEPIWVGWRAGQLMLVTSPPLGAALFARLLDGGRRTAALLIAAVALAIGAPTAFIDMWNAQNVENLQMGPGFRWTVLISPETQAAMNWIREHTPSDAVVQTSIGPRGRETWTLIPSFAQRRMSAGQPISLLHTREYDQRSDAVDAMFRTRSAADASRLARAHRIDYVYVDSVERRAFGHESIAKFEDVNYFNPVFQQGDAAVFQVR
jgi:hypothetical protein